MAVILIVEDDLFIREIAEFTVVDMDHDVLLAEDVGEALLVLRSSRRIDALIADVRLKAAAQGGFELAKQAVALRPGLPVLFTTGNTSTDAMRTLFVEGAHFLQKPYSERQLKHAVEKLLEASEPALTV